MKKGTGSLFDQLLEKQPGFAAALERMAAPSGAAKSNATDPTPIQPPAVTPAQAPSPKPPLQQPLKQSTYSPAGKVPVAPKAERVEKKKAPQHKVEHKKHAHRGARYTYVGLDAARFDLYREKSPIHRHGILMSMKARADQIMGDPKATGPMKREAVEIMDILRIEPAQAKVQPAPQQSQQVVPPHKVDQPAVTSAPAAQKGPQFKPQAKPVPRAPKAVRRSQFFRPDAQFDVEPTKGTCELSLGVDFGTSSTKVAVRDRWVRNTVFTVDWGEFAHANASYLLPSAIWECGDELSLEAGGVQVGDLKLNLLDALANRGSQAHAARCVCFLALVFRYVRTWMMANYRDAYAGFDLVWSANIGVPASGFDDKALLREYKRVAEAAWGLSVNDKLTTMQTAYEALSNPTAGVSGDATADIDVVPEVVAAVVGYAKSPLKENGLHLMVDVGAGTLDVCGFIVHENEGEDRFPLLQSSVEFLGVQPLQKARIDALSDQISGTITSAASDPVAAVPANHSDFVKWLRLDDFVHQAESSFTKKCADVIRRVGFDLKRRRDPNSDVWRNRELPVFLCGGGASVPLYMAAISEFATWLKTQTRSPGVKIKGLPPEPSAQPPLADSAALRLGVALGLSYPRYEIGEMIPSGEIEDIAPYPSPADDDRWWRRKEFIGKEMC